MGWDSNSAYEFHCHLQAVHLLQLTVSDTRFKKLLQTSKRLLSIGYVNSLICQNPWPDLKIHMYLILITFCDDCMSSLLMAEFQVCELIYIKQGGIA